MPCPSSPVTRYRSMPASAGPTAAASPVPLLAVRLKPSSRLAIILGIAHFAAIGLLWPLALPLEAKLAGSAILTASLILYLRHHVAQRSGCVLGFELSEDMTCILQTKEGNIACAILGSTFVAPYLTVIELKPLEESAEGSEGASAIGPEEWSGWTNRWRNRRKHSPRSLVILPDAIDAEAFRQLRVLLRWKWKEPV